MKCSNCGLPITKKDKVCPHCQMPLKRPFKLFLLTSLIFLVVVGLVAFNVLFKDSLANKPEKSAKENPVEITNPKNDNTDKKDAEDEKDEKEVVKNKNNRQEQASSNKEKVNLPDESSQKKEQYIIGENAASTKQPKIEKQKIKLEQKEDIQTFIEQAKKSVFTVTTPEMQGSGFLFDWNGAVVTNAHVVEGWTEATVKTSDNRVFKGKVIGYSNKTDIAVIHIPELAGQKPAAINHSSVFPIGEEVIALGSPNGVQNSATMGFITGQDRNFVIGSFEYKNLYQISAPIASGSSGGPLISKRTHEVIAINSAQSTTSLSIGFSIPMHQVSGLIQSWINKPLTEQQLLKEFYGEDGNLVLGEEWDNEEGYFKEGDYSKDKEHYNYWEYNDNEHNNDQETQEDSNATNNNPNSINTNTPETNNVPATDNTATPNNTNRTGDESKKTEGSQTNPTTPAEVTPNTSTEEQVPPTTEQQN